jgi:protein-tyrosine-phosphatase
MRIHFVCTGNIYRSRLAEAYCISRCASGIHVFSSGIAAGVSEDAPISPYAADVLTKHGLISFAAKQWQPTTPALVKMSDALILMESEHHQFCANWIELARQRVEVWGIEDIGPIAQEEIPEKVDRTFKIIRQRTDTLLCTLGLSDAITGDPLLTSSVITQT